MKRLICSGIKIKTSVRLFVEKIWKPSVKNSAIRSNNKQTHVVGGRQATTHEAAAQIIIIILLLKKIFADKNFPKNMSW